MNEDEDKRSKGDKEIALTPKQYEEIERALQWPEDIEKWDKINKPTNLSELGF